MAADLSTHDVPLDRRGFERALKELQSERSKDRSNPGSYQSEGCVRCVDCMFTTDSTDCFACTYCRGCERCSD